MWACGGGERGISLVKNQEFYVLSKHVSLEKGSDVSLIVKSVKNKWRWAWLEETGEDGHLLRPWCTKRKLTGVNWLLVSASNVTPTECWLNVWCIWYTYLETLQECRSRRRIGWIIQEFWEMSDVCVAFFNVPPWNKDTVVPNPLTKEESCRVYNCDDERLPGSTKRWIFKSMWNIFKVCGIESLKYIREFYTPVYYCSNISSPRNVTENETNCDWLFDMLVKRHHGRALANERGHLFQTFRLTTAFNMAVTAKSTINQKTHTKLLFVLSSTHPPCLVHHLRYCCLRLPMYVTTKCINERSLLNKTCRSLCCRH